MTETKNLKLKTYETVTDGQELVARYIDDTSDNFQKIDEFCKTDTTLSVEGGIADAKTVGDNVSQLKDDLTRLNNTGEESVAAGKVWTTNAAGAGWADPQGGASTWSEITDKPFNTIDRNTLVNRSGALCVNTTDDAEQDNTRPITSSGVHVICGNINALL